MTGAFRRRFHTAAEQSIREVEAEAVAYVFGRYFGLDTSGLTFDDSEVVRDRLVRISTTAEELIILWR